MIQAKRYHDISVGHTVHGHESKCAHLHGHNYRIHFTVEPKVGLDKVGRVIDFSVIKSTLCEWLEQNWDHKFLVSREDSRRVQLFELDPEGVVITSFNPTAENMAEFLGNVLAPSLLPDHVYCSEVIIEETAKCSAIWKYQK